MRKTGTKSYIKELRKQLRQSYLPEQADKILSLLQNSADNFFEDNPDASFEDFLEQFGNIDDLRDSFLENAQDLSKQARQAHSRKMIFIAVSIIVVFIAAIYCGSLIKGYIKSRDSIIKYERSIIY